MLLPLLALTLQASPLAPLDFLVGHCWAGEAPGGGTDTHCFRAVDGKVFDRHEVVKGGKTVYRGETVYEWDAAEKRVRFTYSDPSGVVGRGGMRPDGANLDFGSTVYGTGERKITVATRWERAGDKAYDSVDSSPDSAKFNRRTRYTRVD